MAKTLKTVGTIVGGMVLIATGVGAAMGVNVLGMGIMSYTGSLTVGQLGMISAGTVATGMMLEKPVSTGAGSATDWTSNPDQPTPFAIGRVGASGKIVHRDEYGQDNRLQGIVSVYSGAGPIKSFVSYSTDGVGVTFASNGGTAVGKYNRQMWRSWRLGAQPDTALSLPTGLDGGAVMPGWGAAYRLSGKACELLTLQQDSKFSVYPSGEPKPLAVLEGIHGYDPRYDDTYPGGAGPCRYNDRSTYRYIDNAIIGALNWALGLKENGQVVGGIGASLSGVDLPAFVDAANIADANNWKVTAWPDSSEDVAQVLKQLLQAGGANYARHAGKISCISRAGPHASILTMTARDTAGPIELDTGASRFDRINTITPEFMSEAHGWKHVPASPVSFADFVTEDGGKRSDRIKYRFVPSGSHAAQLAALDILDPREPFSGSVPLKPHMRQLKPGDCFTISEPGFLLDGVKCKVLSRSYNPNTGAVQVAFRSETAGKVELALGKTTTVPAYPELTPADPTFVSPPLPEDWVIVPRPPAPGGVVPGFDLSGEVGNSTATAIEVRYWVVPADGDPEDEPAPDAVGWVSAGTWPPTASSIPIDVEGGRHYWLGLIYIRNQNASAMSVMGPRLAEKLLAGGLTDEARDVLVGEVLEGVDASIGEGLAAGREALDRARALGLSLIDAAASGLAGRLDEETSRYAEVADLLDRLGVLATVDPVGRTSLVRKEAVFEGIGPDGQNQSLAVVQTRLVAGTAAAKLEAQAYSSDQLELALLDYTTTVGVDGKIAAARLLITSEISAAISVSTVNLVSMAQMGTAISTSELAMRNWTNGAITTATTGLISAVGVDNKIAASRLLITGEINGAISTATANLVTVAELDTAMSGAEVALKAYADEKVALGTAGLATKAEIRTNANLMANGSGERGVNGWTGPAGLQATFWQPYGGSIIKLPVSGAVSGYITAPVAQVSGSGQVTLSWAGGRENGFAGTAGVYLVFRDAGGGYISETSAVDIAAATKSITASVPSGAAQAHLAVLLAGTGGAGQSVWLNRVKIENGPVATAYILDGTAADLWAVSAIQAQSLTNIETGLAEASLRLVAAASGGEPAILEIVSSEAVGGVIRLRVPQIYFGESTVLDTVTGLEVGTFGATRRVVAKGLAFGAAPDAGQLLEWEGPNSIGMRAMTRANAYYYRANTEPRHGGSVFGTALTPKPGFQPSKSFVRGGFAENTTETVTISAGGGAGTPNVKWTQRTFESGTWTITSPNYRTTRFTNTTNTGERRDVFEWIAEDGEISQSGIVTAFLPGV